MPAKRDTVSLALPPEKTVRGHKIRKLPLGAYLRAMQALCELPDTLLAALFPGEDASAALGHLRRLTPDTAAPLLAKALAVAPGPLLRALSLLCDIEEKTLLADPDIGADGLIELVQAVIEVNDLANFLQAARATLARLRTSAGCNP